MGFTLYIHRKSEILISLTLYLFHCNFTPNISNSQFLKPISVSLGGLGFHCTLTMLWQNLSSIRGQTHKKLASICSSNISPAPAPHQLLYHWATGDSWELRPYNYNCRLKSMGHLTKYHPVTMLFEVRSQNSIFRSPCPPQQCWNMVARLYGWKLTLH